MNASVSAQISADNSVFLRGVAAAKDAAKSLQSTLSSLKAPPLPDIAKQLGLQKTQTFKDPFGPEWKAGLARGTAALKVELDKQAALFRENNRIALPVINRVALSGAPSSPGMSHLDGTMFAGQGGAGGAGGGGRSRGMGNLAVGYNFIQDYAQGGFGGIANNIPQIIEMAAQSPAMKVLGLTAITAAATTFAGYQAYSLYKNTGDRQLAAAGDRYAYNKDMADSRKLSRDNDKLITDGKQSGLAEGERNRNYIGVEEKDSARLRLASDRLEQMKQAEADLRRLRLSSIKDPAELAKAMAEDQKRWILERIELEKKAAQSELELAALQQKKSDDALLKNRQDLDSLPSTSLTPADIARREQLTGARAGLNDRAKAARARVGAAEATLGDVNFRETSIVPNQIQQIKIQAEMELGRIEEQNFKDRMEGQLAYGRTYREFAEMRKEAEANLAAQRKQAAADDLEAMRERQSGEMEWSRTAIRFKEMKEQADKKLEADKKDREQIKAQMDIAEMQSGSPRRAKKMQREVDLKDSTEKFEQAGFSPQEAKKMAEREQAVQDRKEHPNRIRGVSSRNARERTSGLSYDHSAGMKAVETPNLAEVRGVPRAGKSVDHDLAEKDAAAAKNATAAASPQKEGDTASHALLLKVIAGLSDVVNAVRGIPSPPVQGN